MVCVPNFWPGAGEMLNVKGCVKVSTYIKGSSRQNDCLELQYCRCYCFV